MRKSWSGARRGFALIFAMFIVVLLLLTSLLLLTNSQYTAADTHNSEARTQSFDAAEAGLNAAMDSLDASGTYTVGVGPTSQSVGTSKSTYTYWVYDNIGGTHGTSYAVGTDPVNGNSVQPVPKGFAMIFAQGKGPNGIRSAEVHAVVAPAVNLITFPPYAMTAGLDIQGNWNHKIGIAGSAPGANDANIHANRNITTTVGFLQGTATSSGSTNSLNGSSSGVNTPQVPLPTSQMGPFVAIAQQFSSTPPNVYLPAGSVFGSSYTCPAGSSNAGLSGCVLFYNGPYTVAGQVTTTFTGQWTVVINGDYSSTGLTTMTFQQGQHSLFIVNGNAIDGGNGDAAATLWVKGDAQLNGNGNLFGKVVAGGNINLLGGGSGGGFTYDKSLDPSIVQTLGNVVIKSWAEY